MAKKKVLLMGKAHSGKTSMRSVIFANFLARDTMRLSPTLDVEHDHVRFLGDLVLNLWDCGGQDAFFESYFERDRETIFRSVELLIYVFDIENREPEKDFQQFVGVLNAIEENSPDARIFVLVHKMDLVKREERELILEDRRRLIAESAASCGVKHFSCFGTSIWDETLYRAWSQIVATLIPSLDVLESHLDAFCRMCDADEVVLFEKATFLVISHASQGEPDQDEEEYVLEGEYHPPVAPTTTATTPSTAAKTETAGASTSALTEDAAGGAGDLAASVSGNAADSSFEAGAPSGGGGGGSTSAAGGEGDGDGSATTPAANADARKALHSSRPLPAPVVLDAHRFEKISNIVKQFKLSCAKARSSFEGMEVRNSRFVAYIDAFTTNTYVMVIVSQRRSSAATGAATLLNIRNARRHFERFIPRS